MDSQSLVEVGEQFATFADAFEFYKNNVSDTSKLAAELNRLTLACGMLMVKAIDLGAFGRDIAKINGGWFDRSRARIPGDAITVYGFRPPELLEQTPCGQFFSLNGTSEAQRVVVEKFIRDLQSISMDWQFQNLWCATVEWIRYEFPLQVRHSGEKAFNPVLRGPAAEERDAVVHRMMRPAKGRTVSDRAKNAAEMTRRRILTRQAEVSSDVSRIIAGQIVAGIRQRDRSLQTARWAADKARHVGRSVTRLLSWIHTCRDAGDRHDSSYRNESPPDPSMRNVDVDGIGWGIVVGHVASSTGFPVPELEDIALFVSANCPQGRPDLREKHDRLQAKLNLPENHGLIDIILIELDERCPGLAADIPRTIQTAIQVFEVKDPKPVLLEAHAALEPEGTAQSSSDNVAKLPRRYRLALIQHQNAIEARPELESRPDHEVYAFAKEQLEEGESIPPMESWCRYVRQGRAAFGKQKNRRRAGVTSRSAVRYKDI